MAYIGMSTANTRGAWRRSEQVYIVMAYIVMAYIVMAYIVMAYIVMAYKVMDAGLCRSERDLMTRCRPELSGCNPLGVRRRHAPVFWCALHVCAACSAVHPVPCTLSLPFFGHGYPRSGTDLSIG